MLSSEQHMDNIRDHWAVLAARQRPPTCVYLVIAHDGHLIGWAWSRPKAVKLAEKQTVNCHIARLDPRDY